ncbi:MAG: SMC-Scp complex subunit ScpB [Gammaproteobacteria bacterium]
MDTDKLKLILQAVLMAAEQPLSIEQIERVFEDDEERPERAQIRSALEALADACEGQAYELKQVAGGWRLQVRQDYAGWVGRLWEEKPPRYSRAVLETLALIAYRQPITRGEIEDIRGVSVSTHIVKTLTERNWVKVVGHKDLPGRPSLYGTTREFLDYFNLKTLDELPTLAEIRDLDSIVPQLDLGDNAEEGVATAHLAANEERAEGDEVIESGAASIEAAAQEDEEAVFEAAEEDDFDQDEAEDELPDVASEPPPTDTRH